MWYLGSSQLVGEAAISSDWTEQSNAAHVRACPGRALAHKSLQLSLAHPGSAASMTNITIPSLEFRTVQDLCKHDDLFSSMCALCRVGWGAEVADAIGFVTCVVVPACLMAARRQTSLLQAPPRASIALQD